LSGYFLIGYQIVGFSDDLGGFGGFLGLSIKYNRNNPITKHPINMYNNSSTLLYKYNLGHKKPTD